LKDYDNETKNFYRWKEELTQSEIKELISAKTGIDFGNILDLIPLERGKSGRIVRLKIIGTKKEKIFGKELEIRKILSKSHLYSSAFFVEKKIIIENVPQVFVLRGAGWGHGVGLCQIGAAVMSNKGYEFDEILNHYFPNAQIKKLF
jgi:SpoIID/LytB domain protein